MTHERSLDEDKAKKSKPQEDGKEKGRPVGPEQQDRSGLVGLQQTIGNRAAQRLLAQRSGA